MDWREYLMSAVWGLVGSIIGVIGTLGFGIWSDKKEYNKINNKVGELNNTTLSGQHNEISNLIKDVNKNVKDTIIDRAELTDKQTREMHSKLYQMTKMMDKNEGRYENLNLDQREVRNNVSKLINSWEKLIEDNKELKNLIMGLKNENEYLKSIINEQNNILNKDRDYEDDWELEL